MPHTLSKWELLPLHNPVLRSGKASGNMAGDDNAMELKTQPQRHRDTEGKKWMKKSGFNDCSSLYLCTSVVRILRANLMRF